MELIFKTFEKQRIALRALRNKTTNEVLYGGGARGGKSWLGCGWVIMEAVTKPESAWLIAREELTKLRDTTLKTFFKVLKHLGLVRDIHYHYNAQDFTCTFSNGSIVYFREIKYIPSDPEFDRLGSYDLTGCFLDECQQIHAKAISVLRGRFSVLSGEGWETIPKSLYTCNPSKNWIYTDFVKPSKNGTLSDDRLFVASLATDNPFIDERYIENLRKSDKVTVARLLYGDFDYDDDPTSMCQYDDIVAMFSNDHVTSRGTKYVIADIARYGSDAARVSVFDDWIMIEQHSFPKSATTEIQNCINAMRTKHDVPAHHCLADEDGVGGGVVDNCGIIGFVNNSSPIPMEAALDNEHRWQGPKGRQFDPMKENYYNLQSQCAYLLAQNIIAKHKTWLKCIESETDKERIISEFTWLKTYDADKDGKLRILPKAKVKEAIGTSPDWRDLLIMRYYFELVSTEPDEGIPDEVLDMLY